MPTVTITNNGDETLNIPLYGVTLEPGASADVEVDDPAEIHNVDLSAAVPVTAPVEAPAADAPAPPVAPTEGA